MVSPVSNLDTPHDAVASLSLLQVLAEDVL